MSEKGHSLQIDMPVTAAQCPPHSEKRPYIRDGSGTFRIMIILGLSNYENKNLFCPLGVEHFTFGFQTFHV